MSISTHAPLAGRDRAIRVAGPHHPPFQPTRPLRGATVAQALSHPGPQISTHAPLAGRDPRRAPQDGKIQDFNPRAPCGARRLRGRPWQRSRGISTHAPLAGRDLRQPQSAQLQRHFNPRAPCGARLQKCTNHYAHFCDNRQISDAFAQNADCQGILFLFDAGKPCGFWVRTAQVISARLCFAL